MPHIMIIHPEGNINNNPNLTGIVEILCDQGYKVDIYSPRIGHIEQSAPCAGAKVILANMVMGPLSNVIAVLPIEVFQGGAARSNYIANNIPHYDLVIGVDRGIIEASIIAKHQRVPYGLISYEILFSEETGKDYFKLDIDASRDAAFAVCQDRVRSFHLSRENHIPLERIIDIPVAGRSAKQGERTFILHEKLGLPPQTKIALYIGGVTYKWAGIDELITGSDQWPDDWVLVLHQRYSLYPKEFINNIASKGKKNVYISPFPFFPFSQLHQLIHSADIGLSFYIPQFQSDDISARNNLRYVGLSSGKTSTYLQHGLPILINEVGEMADYTRGENLGRVVGDIRDIHAVLSTLSREELTPCRDNCTSFFKSRLDLDLRIKPLLSTIHRLIKDTQFDQSVTLNIPKVESTKSPWIVCSRNLQAQEMAENKFKELQNSITGCNRQQIISKYNSFIIEFPLFALAHNDIGVIYTQVGDDAKALQHYEAAVRNQPDNATFAKNLADFYLVKVGRIQDAIQIYCGVLDSNPNDLETILTLGNINAALNQYETAKAYYTRALEVEPANATARQGLDALSQASSAPIENQNQNAIAPLNEMVQKIYQKVQTFVKDGQHADAIAELEKLLTIHPGFALAYNDLGVIYYNKGDKESAQKYYEQAVALNPENINFQKNLADFYFIELGRIEDAIRIYLKVLTEHPEDIEVLLAIGNFCVTVGKVEEARIFCDRVLKIDPENKDALKIIDLLNNQNKLMQPEQADATTIEVINKSAGYLVSAIVSTYNSEKFIRGCLEDLTNQTLFKKGKLEIVIVNSGSQQNEEAISDDFIQKYHKQIIYLKTEIRESIYQAWNRGIKVASGKYITNANTDDRHRHDALEVLANLLDSMPTVDLAYADVFVTNFENQTFESHIRTGYQARPDYNKEIMLSGCHMGPQPMWRKSLHDKNGFFDENLKSASDYEFWCRIAVNHSMMHIPEFLGLYYENPQGFCNADIKLSADEAMLIQRRYADKLPHPKGNYTNNYQYLKPVTHGKYVNICMITYNRLDFTKQAITSLVTYTCFPHVITVVDNNSQDGTKEFLKALHNKGIIKNLVLLDENVGVAKASNLAWSMEPEAEYYLKLDNDIVIKKKNWLTDMVRVIDGIPQAGAVAYNFEPVSYPLTDLNNIQVRVKPGILGGACILIPKRTERLLGYWCEDYGLYGEEDADYGVRIRLSGLLNIYMEDENMGVHLPAGKAAVIDQHTFMSTDGIEEKQYAEYRRWKDEIRKKNAGKEGDFQKHILEYQKGTRSLYYAPSLRKDSKMDNAIYESAKPIPRKKFSIVILTWNRARMLDLCLKSLFKNLSSRDECEIIIGDNGSSDATAEVISRYQIDKYIRKNSNIGLELYHELFDLAQGEYLIELDDDVLDLPFGFEKKFEEYFAAFPDYGLLGLDVVQNEHTNGAKPDKSAYREDARGNLTIEEGLTGGWCLCLKRLTFEQIGKFGGLVLNMEQSEDGVLWNRVRAHGMRAGIIKDLKCLHACGPYFSQKYGYLERDIDKYAISGIVLWNNRLYRKGEATAASPAISIVVPLFNRIDFTKKCIAAIQKTVSKLIYELILVDNNSNDATAEYLKTLGDQVCVITNSTNLGFAKACNQGAKAASCEYLLFLNNDTEPQQGWLEPLVEILDHDDSVAAVGSKLIYPDGTIQHAGIVVVDDRKNNDHLLAKNNHVGKSADAPEANTTTLHQALTAACVLIRKSAFKKAGGFDEKYWNGYEDVDLCFKLQEQRGKLVYQPASVVIHHESQSGPERFAKAPDNIARLHKKWLGKIKPDIILNKNGSVQLTDAGKIRPYAAPGLPQKQLIPKASTLKPKLVSIVILTFNELKYTRECIESIKKHTPQPHEIIFIDNASTDGTLKWLRKISQENENYKLIENKNNLGFAKGCNQGIEAASGEYILLLNNDVVVTENWLSGMLECLKSSPDAGIVGPMTNNISGTQKVYDADYKTIPGMIEYAKSFRDRHRHRRVSCRRIVGFCMLLRHTLVDKIGLLDDSFGTGNFEDDDYCLRATLAGYQNLIAGDVFIHHYGSRSFIGNKIDYGSSISGNIQIYDEKWLGIDVNTPLGKKFTAFNFIEKADTLNQKGQLDKAIAMFIEGIKYAPAEKAVYYRLAEMLLDAKLNKDALEAVESMSQEMEDDLKRLEIIAYCTEDIEEAGKLADRILAVDKNYAAAINLKGINAYKQGDLSLAEDFFKKAIVSDPGYGEPYTNLGIMKCDSDQKEEALDCLEKGFILSPTLTDNVTLYHTAITALEQFDRAEKLFQDAKYLHPENKRILFFLIDIFIKQGKYDDAMHEIEQAMLDIGIDDGMLAAALEIRQKVGIKEIDKVKNKGTLSLCMIVKNEERHLTRCLLSATPAVDEMIVVDTGSTDRTKDIAKAFGAKVFDFPWTNDFSEARNVSLSKASGDWILVLDADEVISALDYPAIEKIVKKKAAKPAAYTLVTRNYTNEVCSKGWIANDRKYLLEEAGTGWFPSDKVRLFVNDKRIQFQNPVHEFVETTVEKAGIEIKTSGIPVHHYGRFDTDKIIAKGKEYFLLGKKKFEEMKDDIKALKELAIQASELEEYVTAVELWKRVIELKPNDSVVFLNIGYAYMKLGKYEETLISSRRAMELDPTMKEAALNYAGSEFIIGDIKKTISVLETLLRKNSYYPPAMVLVAAAYYVDGQKERAIEIFEQLRKKRFDCTEFFDEQIRALMSQEKFEQAFSLIEAAVKTGSINNDTKTLLAECHSKMVSKGKG